MFVATLRVLNGSCDHDCDDVSIKFAFFFCAIAESMFVDICQQLFRVAKNQGVVVIII